MNILESILQKKRRRLAEGIAAGAPGPARHLPRELLRRFQGAAPGVIAEMKKASPSAGLIRAQYDPVSLARQYQEAGAFAISVLTEQDFFQGSLEQLRAVREAVDLPLLRKDFILAPEQLKETRSHGADMALLIVACLEQELLQALVAAAGQEQLLPLVEVHDEGEADRAMDAGARLLGINNRNLKSFQVDLQTGARVAAYVRKTYGDEIVLVAESGIHSAGDIEALAAAGCQAFLIGESLLRAESPGQALAALLAEIERRKAKGERRKAKVEGRRSKVEGRKSKVEGRRSKVGDRKSKGESGKPPLGARESQTAAEGSAGGERSDNELEQSDSAPESPRDAPSATYDPQPATCDLRPSTSDFRSTPDAGGHYGCYGGKFVPETLMAPLQELEAAYIRCCGDTTFREELDALLREYVGRPTPLTFAARLSRELAARIYFKREDLCHTGAHKINNALGQALLARRMGKRRIVAETGAGQHGVAAATVCALLGLECCVYMGVEDMARQELNVFRMRLLGADVVPVRSGSRTLKDAINETMRDWVSNVEQTHYLLGSVLGPHPYPRMVRDFQSVIGREARAQILEKEARLPDVLIACVGGGSNSLGLFYPFLGDDAVAMVGVEAGGRGSGLGEHAARFRGGSPGVLHGCYTYLLQDTDGQIAPTHSISAGLDYAAVGPEHALLHDAGRIRFTAASDGEALRACRILAETEGLISALESAHAVAELLKDPASWRGRLIIVNLSGRGDKDMSTLREEIEKGAPERPSGDEG